MFTWLAFINACFFLMLGSFLFSTTSLFQLLLTSELCWVALYSLAAVFGVFIDDAGCFSVTFFILGFAAIELCFGLLTVLLMRYFNLSIFIPNNKKKLDAQLLKQLNQAAHSKTKF